MHEELGAAIERAGGDPASFTHLSQAFESSETQIAELREELNSKVPASSDNNVLDIVVFGSVARRESTTKSDLDYLLIAHGMPSDPMLSRKLLRATDDYLITNRVPSPGGTGMFGTIVSAPDLLERIGLEQDTNTSHSRRVLLLEESESVYQPQLLAELRRTIVGRYLIDYQEQPKHGPPRFLLNDVMRYWRTTTVDYQAKRWEGQGRSPDGENYSGWGLRYLKLLISRKLTYAGALVPLLVCDEADPDHLAGQFALPSLVRFAQLAHHPEFGAHDELLEAITILDRFVGSLDREGFRDAAKKIASRNELEESDDLRATNDDAERLQELLEVIFLDALPLAPLSRRYLSF